MIAPPPFLSVICRTQGRRPHPLAETLASLARQTDQDFELLLMAHKLDRDGLAALAGALGAIPQNAAFRRRVIPVDGGTRTAPLNAGLDAASGAYLAILDDDDIALPNWVAAFRRLAAGAPGRMLRAATRQQRVVAQRIDGQIRAVPLGGLEPAFPDYFDFFEHLSHNRTPPLALAFPLERLRTHGLRFDDALTTTEDLDFILRCAGPLGVAESAEVTAIYRYWEQGECSRTVHTDVEWNANYRYISDKLNAAPFVLPPENFLRLRAMRDGLAAASAEVASLRGQLTQACERGEKAAAEIAGLRRSLSDAEALSTRLLAVEGSTSWRMTAPMRWLLTKLRDNLRSHP
jgi:glycosyltransferase involved in cell wall biosynthesis